MENKKKEYNSIVYLSKFTSSKKILSKVIVIGYNQVCSQTLSFLKKNLIS